jgi:uncharacterized protein
MGARVAIIGSGGSGLSAAYELRDQAELTIFEREPRPGGHANTVVVEEDGTKIGLDTGFIVFNARTYPNLVGYFEELGVGMLDHKGGYNFFDLDTGLQYGSRDLGRSLEDVERSYPEEFVNIWHEARRFRRQGARDYRKGRTNLPLGDYLDEHGYSEAFKRSYMILLASAAWSVPAEQIWEMPASTVIGFFVGHDAEGLGGREVEWKTVSDGSSTYVRRVLGEIGADLRVGSPATGVREIADGVEVLTAGGSDRFDFCIVATHADEALDLVEKPTPLAREILSQVRYHPTTAVVHTDASLLPPDKDRWQSWNYGRVTRDGALHTYIVWWLNHVHGFDAKRDYFVTLAPPLPIKPDAVIAEIPYSHPVLTIGVREAQDRIYDLNESGRVKYAGSYFHAKELGADSTGYHEAAFVSGREAGRATARELADSITRVSSEKSSV